MKRLVPLVSAAAFLAVAAIVPVHAATDKHANQLVILATTDVKGKTGPCGCHVPKGGLSRRAFFRDSVANLYGQLSLVDNGNFFPAEGTHDDEAWFLMDAMKKLGVDAVGTGANDLRFGYANLKAHLESTGLPMTSANLIDATTRQPALAPYVLTTVGKVKVGYFSLMNPASDLGAARDSLKIADPATTAKKMVADLRRQGANAVVLLSQLGNIESEDLVTMVPGIDAVVCGRNSPVMAKGRMFNATVASYPGEQGHYIGMTTLTLGAGGKVSAKESATIQLGPEIADRPDVLAMVKTFDTAFQAKVEKDSPATIEGHLGRPEAAATSGGH